jgi:hypothetical protein
LWPTADIEGVPDGTASQSAPPWLDKTHDAGEFRLIHVFYLGILTLTDLTLQNGCADGNQQQNDGGTIRVDGESDGGMTTLVLNGVTVTNHQAPDKSGGLDTTASTVAITDSTFTLNTAGGGAGGIGNGNGSTMTIEGTTVANNTAAGLGGGGIGNFGMLTIVNSTISNNAASPARSRRPATPGPSRSRLTWRALRSSRFRPSAGWGP